MIPIGFRLRLGREFLRWNEPLPFATQKRAETPVRFGWWKRLLSAGLILLLSYLNWYFRFRDTPKGKEMTLGACMAIGGFIAFWIFIQIPWMFRSVARAWLDSLGLHWWRGPRWGGITYSNMAGYDWKTKDGICVLQVRRRTGSVPIEIGVPSAEVRDQVTALLDSYQVPRASI